MRCVGKAWLVVALALGCGGRSGSHAPNGEGAQAGAMAEAGAGGGGGQAAGAAGGGVGGRPVTCADYVAPPNGSKQCRGPNDCSVAEQCLAPGESVQGCGICLSPERQCEKSGDCAVGFICVEFSAPCTCTSDQPSSVCQHACADDDCGDGMRCNTTSGLCEPVPCGDGYSCPDGGTCGGAPADGHGCVPLRCEDGFECPENTRCAADASGHGCDVVRCSGDATCDCGACVNGRCASGPGHCAPIPI